MSNDLPILLIKQRDFDGNLFQLLFLTWDTISYKTTVLFSQSNVLWDCFGKADLQNSTNLNFFVFS